MENNKEKYLISVNLRKSYQKLLFRKMVLGECDNDSSFALPLVIVQRSNLRDRKFWPRKLASTTVKLARHDPHPFSLLRHASLPLYMTDTERMPASLHFLSFEQNEVKRSVERHIVGIAVREPRAAKVFCLEYNVPDFHKKTSPSVTPTF